MNRRRFLAAVTLGVASAGCLEEATAGEDRSEGVGGATGSGADCPRETIEVYPAVELPGDRAPIDPARAGLLALEPVAQALETAAEADTDAHRGAIDAEDQTDEDNRLATVTVPDRDSDAVHERLGGITYVTYQGREYVLIFVYTVC